MYAVLVAVQIFFATLPIAVKVALRDLSPPALALLRVGAASLLFLALRRAAGGARVQGWRDHARIALYALFGVVLNQLLYISALTLTTATDAQTMIAAGPAFTLLVAIVLGRERATPAKWVGIALAASGAVALVGAGFGSGTAAGNLLALLNVASYSIYLVISRDVLKRYDALTVITWVFVYGTLGIAPWGAWGLASLDHAPSTATWLALAWIVVVPTVGAYYLNLWALKRVEASLVAVFVYLQPVLTALFASWLLNEHPSPRLLPAAAMIFAGVGVTAWAERRQRRAAAATAAAEEEDDAGALRCE